MELNNKQWQKHSHLKYERFGITAVSMPKGIFVFGGYNSRTSWEWLPNGMKEWQRPSGNNFIPGAGFAGGCAVKINDYEILLIGGDRTEKRLLKFNTATEQFTNLGDILKFERSNHACIRFQEDIIITGGSGWSSTEIINVHNLTNSYIAGNMVEKRSSHGLVAVHIKRS